MIGFSPPIVALIAPVTAALSVLLGWRVYRHSREVDEAAARVTIVAGHGLEVGQVIDALDKHNANLQADNAVLRETRDDCERQLDLIRRIPSAP